MIIVSQDKLRIYNFDNLIQIYLSSSKEKITVNCETIDGLYEILGGYETKERAKEVLNRISTAYTNAEILKIPKLDFQEIITSKQISRTIRYEMPEE